MVKNISNPINARRVASIISEDATSLGHTVAEREISVFLSDHNFDDIVMAIDALRSNELLPSEFKLTNEGILSLEKAEFLEPGYTGKESSDAKKVTDQLTHIPFQERPLEFKTQFESLKNKVVKSWSGGLQSTYLDLDKFNSAFSKPMSNLKQEMEEENIKITDLQAYGVIFGSDHLGLGESNQKMTYELLFGRHESFKEKLNSRFNIRFSWPDESGSMFIQKGQKYGVVLEFADFARKVQSVSGLDTYSDEVVQELFYQLLDGSLTDELVAKKMIFRWTDEVGNEHPFDWTIPLLTHDVMRDDKKFFIQASLAQIMLTKLEPHTQTLEEIMDMCYDLTEESRLDFLVNKIEHALTRKSVGIQYGTAIANSFENFKTNPSKSNPFIEIMYRYFIKSESMKHVLLQLRHSIITGLKISTGLMRQYVRELTDDELIKSIDDVIFKSLEVTFLHYSIHQQFEELLKSREMEPLFSLFDFIINPYSKEKITEIYKILIDNAFYFTKEFTDSLGPKRDIQGDTEGGMQELTQDFLSTSIYHAKKNPNVPGYLESAIQNGLNTNIAEIVVNISSYSTYQIAGREGDDGKKFVHSLIDFYGTQYNELIGRFPQLVSGSNFDSLYRYYLEDLTQAHVIIGLGSRIKTDIFNAWTPIQKSKNKSIHYLINFIIPNLVLWQRLPKEYIMDLASNDIIAKVEIPVLIEILGRFSMINAYCLIVMTILPNINTFADAKTQLQSIFNIQSDVNSGLKLNPRYGEAEIAKETSHLWFALLAMKEQ